MSNETTFPTAIINGVPLEGPEGAIAYKYADPIEDGRWIFDESDIAAIEAEDSSLIARVIPQTEDTWTPDMISMTATVGRGLSGRRVSHMTPEERACVRDGGIVVIDGCGPANGSHGTEWREIVSIGAHFYTRVPSPQVLAAIEAI